MGCDIHLRVEVRTDEGWRPLEKVLPWEDKPAPWKEQWNREHPDDKYRMQFWPSERFYYHRNYDVFAVLADVRNGYGFAGITTGESLPFISAPRGLPEDLSKELLEAHENDDVDDDAHFWLGDHSHSWLTLREVVDWPHWKEVRQKTGVVDAKQYLVWKEKGQPESWSGAVSGGSVKHVSNQGMDELIAGGLTEEDEWPKPGKPSYYTRVFWTEVIEDSCQDFLKFIERLVGFLKEHGWTEGDGVRLVFGFDS